MNADKILSSSKQDKLFTQGIEQAQKIENEDKGKESCFQNHVSLDDKKKKLLEFGTIRYREDGKIISDDQSPLIKNGRHDHNERGSSNRYKRGSKDERRWIY